MLIVVLTFDIDLTNYINNDLLESEINETFPLIMSLMDSYPECKTTLFIRLDKQIEHLYGRPDYIFMRCKEEIEYLKSLGHEIGWHPHCYKLKNGKWVQNIDVDGVLKELKSYVSYVKDYGIKSFRMGWGWQNNAIFDFLQEEGFNVDSSAIPRPKYKWEQVERDWLNTPKTAYLPSIEDYRVPGIPHRDIIEVPISVTQIPAPYDDEIVERYINLSFHSSVLKEPIENWIRAFSMLVTITHPYELHPGDGHLLISHSIDVFKENIALIRSSAQKLNKGIKFVTISDLADIALKENIILRRDWGK